MGFFWGKIAVVTGAGSGIGAALSNELARRGARVIRTDIEARGDVRELDVTQPEAVEALVSSTFEREGGIDYWVNNAGIGLGGATDELELEDWKRVLDVNLAGVIHGVHAVYPRLIRQGSGHIVNVASVAGLAPYPLALPYTTSKHAVVGLSLALRAEAQSRGVRVSVACPGAIETAIWQRAEVRGSLAAQRARLLSLMPRRMSAERCAAAIVRGVEDNRGVIPISFEARAAWWLNRASPALASSISAGLASFARSHRHRGASS
jgi:short-subunit dehydrogenase